MSNSLSPEILAQFYAQESTDPLLTLLTLSHSTFSDDIRLVNNTVNVTSNGKLYTALPMKVSLPVDDGESAREFSLELDNVSLDLVVAIRSVTSAIGARIDLILASLPDVVQMSQTDLLITSIQYTAQRVSAKIQMDNFLTVEITSERYNPDNFAGMF